MDFSRRKFDKSQLPRKQKTEIMHYSNHTCTEREREREREREVVIKAIITQLKSISFSSSFLINEKHKVLFE